MTTTHNKNRHSWDTHDWLIELDNITTLGQDWLSAQPPRSEDDIPSVTAAKQLADEACQFASTISAAIKLNHTTSAYANLRPLVDRLLHAARFFENPMDAMDWAYWSKAELYRLINIVLEQGSTNTDDRDATKEILRTIRHWNRDLNDKDRQMLRPGAYPWSKTLEALTNDANPRLKSAYSLTSTYVHPTYRQPTAPDLGVNYLLSQSLWITAATVIICAASLAHFAPVLAAYPVDSNLLSLIDALNQFLAGDHDFTRLADNPPQGVQPSHVLYFYAAMLFSFIFDREIIEGQPRFT